MDYRRILFIFIFIFVVLIAKELPKNIICQITGIELKGGIPTSSYVVMGLSDSADGPGVFNGSTINTYKQSEYNTEKSDVISKEYLKDTIKRFVERPKELVSFLIRKVNYLWNNPMFGSTSIISKNISTISNNPIWELFENTKFIYVFQQYSHYFHMVIILGGVLYAICNPNETLVSYIYIIIVLGGFLFHGFWEVYVHYSLPYFLLLFPYTAKGFKEVHRDNYLIQKKEKSILIVILCVAFIPSIFLWKKGITYEEYELQTGKADGKLFVLENNTYNLSNHDRSNGKKGKVHFQKRISVYSEDGINYKIREMETGRLISYNAEQNIIYYLDDINSLDYDENNSKDNVKIFWKIKKDEKENYIVFNDESYILSYNKDKGELILTKTLGLKDEKMIIVQE